MWQNTTKYYTGGTIVIGFSSIVQHR